MLSRLSRATISAAASLSLAVLAGCSTAHVSAPLTRTLAGNEPESQGEFWYQLAKQPIASNDDAFHALLLYINGKDPAVDFTARVKTLRARQMLPGGFNGNAADAVDRGTLAVALDHMLHIQGGLTMRVFGPSPRYALRAAEERGLFPPSSPNQGVTGGEFVGVMQKAEEFEHGNPSDQPVNEGPQNPMPAVTLRDADSFDVVATMAEAKVEPQMPIYLDDALGTPPTTTATSQPAHLKAIVTGTQGELVEIRSNATAEWKRAKLGMVLREGTEIRTGPKSAIRFLIPQDEAFALDSQGTMTLQQAVASSKSAKTRIDLDRGRLREDLSHNAPVQIEEAGIEHDTVIKSPNSALALRGTKVSLFEQPSFEPVAVSLTGQALFTNTNGLTVPFGGRNHVVIVGNQTSAGQQADARASAAVTANTARVEFETRELAIVAQRGGFQRGDVIVGNLSINDFKTLPGALDFVLQWTGGVKQSLNDLNLAVFSPNDPVITRNPSSTHDYVANPPFTVSLTPNSPASIKTRKALYPQSSRTGGQITTNSVGPNGLELAFWPKNYPVGTYGVVVYNLVDAIHPPATTTDPVNFTVDVYRNGVRLFQTYKGTVGLLQTSPLITYAIASPVSTAGQLAASAKLRAGSTLPFKPGKR